jgi:hypothetical protein
MYGHRSRQINDFIKFLAPRSGRQIISEALYNQVVINYELPGAICDCILAISEAARTLQGPPQNDESSKLVTAIRGFSMEFLRNCFLHETQSSPSAARYLPDHIFTRMFPSPNPSKSLFQKALELEVIKFLSALNDTFRSLPMGGYTFDLMKSEKVFIAFGIGIEKILGSYLTQSLYTSQIDFLVHDFYTVSI